MADAFVSEVLQQLASIIYQEMQQEVRMVVGVETEVQKLISSFESIQAVLIDAEKRQVKEQAVKVWLGKLRDISYDIEDVLDEWRSAILKVQIEGVGNDPITKKKVCSYIPSPCFCFNRVVMRHDIALEIKNLNGRLDGIASEKDRYNFQSITNVEEPDQRQKTTPFVDESGVFGRDQDKKTIVSKLLCENSQEEKRLHIISIVGMGGIGKTTLAQLAYNDDEVKAHFDKRIWVCVSDPFDEIRIAKTIAKALDGSDPSFLDWENIPQHIYESIAGKKFILVLDDVWTEDFKKWEPFEQCLKSGAQGSRILVTTRNERVARMMGTTYMHTLEELSKEVCRSLFNQIAFFGRSREDYVKLEEIGVKIADKCKGLPLAAKTLGSLMRFKKTEQDWRNVLNSEIWELEEVEKGLFPPLLLSYYDLPSALKRCFSYCAIFPKGYVIEIDILIQLWMAQGYLSSRSGIEMEITGREYFENLAMRSFFQDYVKDEDDGSISSCKMHDIVHDFSQYLTKNECFIMKVYGGKGQSIDSTSRKGRQSTVILAAEAKFPISIFNGEKLLTLFVVTEATTGISDGLPHSFHHLKCLRALDLRENSIEELPREIGKLIHLRYLNLSRNKFGNLPETVCDLCNLQTLDLTFCIFLKELPKGIGKLVNLRHLKIYWMAQLNFLPKGIRRLSSIRTLSRFIINGGDEREVCKLRDLENLNNLEGRLEIEGLGNVVDAGEAEKAKLKCKEHLLGLKLIFSSEVAKGNTDEVIEALQPHPNLELLTVCSYRGILFPKWIMLLDKLKKLELSDCINCVGLPPLGKLPALESLEIAGNDSLRKVGVEFLGFGVDDDKNEASMMTAFPKLKQFSLRGMSKWEEWDMTITSGRKEGEIMLMPSLRSLTFEYCPKLRELPQHLRTRELEELKITHCPLLQRSLLPPSPPSPSLLPLPLPSPSLLPLPPPPPPLPSFKASMVWSSPPFLPLLPPLPSLEASGASSPSLSPPSPASPSLPPPPRPPLEVPNAWSYFFQDTKLEN